MAECGQECGDAVAVVEYNGRDVDLFQYAPPRRDDGLEVVLANKVPPAPEGFRAVRTAKGEYTLLPRAWRVVAEALGVVAEREYNHYARRDKVVRWWASPESLEEAERERESALAALKWTVELYSDFKSRTGIMAVTDANGTALEVGPAGVHEQSDGELEAALAAVELAGRAREALGQPTLCLLRVDASWLCHHESKKQKGYALTERARELGLELAVTWVPGDKNPADAFTLGSDDVEFTDDAKNLARSFQTSDLTDGDEQAVTA